MPDHAVTVAALALALAATGHRTEAKALGAQLANPGGLAAVSGIIRGPAQ